MPCRTGWRLQPRATKDRAGKPARTDFMLTAKLMRGRRYQLPRLLPKQLAVTTNTKEIFVGEPNGKPRKITDTAELADILAKGFVLSK